MSDRRPHPRPARGGRATGFAARAPPAPARSGRSEPRRRWRPGAAPSPAATAPADRPALRRRAVGRRGAARPCACGFEVGEQLASAMVVDGELHADAGQTDARRSRERPQLDGPEHGVVVVEDPDALVDGPAGSLRTARAATPGSRDPQRRSQLHGRAAGGATSLRAAARWPGRGGAARCAARPPRGADGRLRGGSRTGGAFVRWPPSARPARARRPAAAPAAARSGRGAAQAGRSWSTKPHAALCGVGAGDVAAGEVGLGGDEQALRQLEVPSVASDSTTARSAASTASSSRLACSSVRA